MEEGACIVVDDESLIYLLKKKYAPCLKISEHKMLYAKRQQFQLIDYLYFTTFSRRKKLLLSLIDTVNKWVKKKKYTHLFGYCVASKENE